MRYRLKSPTMAIQPGGADGRMQFVTVPAGALVTVVGETQQSGLVDVLFDGRVVAMFFCDIEERGQKSLAKAV